MRFLRCDQIDDFAAVFHASPHGPARIDQRAFAADFFAPADLGGDFGGDQQDRPGDGAAFLDAHLAEVFAVHQLLGAIGRHGKFVEIFQRHVFLGHGLGGGFFHAAFFIAAFLGVGLGRRALNIHGLHRHALVSSARARSNRRACRMPENLLFAKSDWRATARENRRARR